MRIFFSGIAGSGVSALATFMAGRGHSVAGSDRAFERDPAHALARILKAGGIVITPQDGSGIVPSLDCAVFSTAVEPDRPEIVRARELGIPVKTRPEFLAEIAREFRTTAVAGTSGKSTAAGLLAFLMDSLGLCPNLISGGRVKQFRTSSNPGNSITGESDLLVIEACESDGTIVSYHPLHSIILNLALDHHCIADTAAMFQKLIDHTAGLVVLNADDPNLRRLRTGSAVTFSAEGPADYTAEDIGTGHFGSEFTVRGTRFRLSLPGLHNVSNALACIAFLIETGVPAGEVSRYLPGFSGIERRFDIHLNSGGRLVVDDYAHNPHKIAALMSTAGRIRDKACYVFQPHGFGPTRMMREEYIAAFVRHLRPGDHLILLPIFYAGGTAQKDISSRDLAAGVRSGGCSAEVVEDRMEILKRASQWDTWVIFGARDDTLSGLAEDLALRLGKR